MYVQKLQIRDVRSFKSATLTLRHPGEPREPNAGDAVQHLPNITLLLGNNGSGKTTVLRAIALSALSPIIAQGSGFVPYALVRRVGDRAARSSMAEASAWLHAQDIEKRELPASLKIRLIATEGFTDRFKLPNSTFRWATRMYNEESPAFFVLGYGATRRVEADVPSTKLRAKERLLRYQRVAGLFEEHVTLVPLSSWLRVERVHQREVFELINSLLPDARLLQRPAADGEYLFKRGGSALPYPALSDGYRAFISWVGDLLYHLCRACPPGMRLVDCKGIVLVDEVDLHLHPEWQRHIVPSLARTFPNLQFVLTSHSPLVTGTLSSRNILRLEECESSSRERFTRIHHPEDELYGLSADQILTSDSFKLESTRDERFFERLKDAAVEARDGGAEKALRFMRMVGGGAAAERIPPTPGRRRTPEVKLQKKAPKRMLASGRVKRATPSRKTRKPSR